MGTNYYWQAGEDRCRECGRSDNEEIHIGKSSAGWCFMLHVDPAKEIEGLADWLERWFRDGSRIRDDYGTDITATEMWAIVMCRRRAISEKMDGAWYARNHAKPGPLGLARSTYNATPGDGPYDLVTGEFS